jgi:hypothetical protein
VSTENVTSRGATHPALRENCGFYLWRGSLTEDYGRAVVGGLGGRVGESASLSGEPRP